MRLFKPSGAVGLELDNEVIRVIELNGTGNKAQLVSAGQVEIPGGAVQEGVVKDVQLVADALKELWAKTDIDQREVVMGVANQGLMMRLATFPKIAADKLAKALRFQVDEYFPIPLTELVFDFAVVGEIDGDKGPQLEILLVAIRKDLLYNSLDALNAASLIPRVVDASPLALMRTIDQDVSASNMVLADISNDLITLLLVGGGVPRFARVVPHAQVTQTAGQLISLEKTTEQQVAATMDEDNQTRPGTWFDGLAGDISSTITYYMAQGQAAVVDKVIVSGRGSSVQGLVEYLQADLELPVEVINPLTNLHGPVQAGDVNLHRYGPEYAVSIGLALRGLEK